MNRAPSLSDLPKWQYTNQFLHREFVFKNFSAAFAFMTQVAMLAEVHDHHPNWSNVYNKVLIQLQTHTAGDVTEKDLHLAAAINGLT